MFTLGSYAARTQVRPSSWDIDRIEFDLPDTAPVAATGLTARRLAKRALATYSGLADELSRALGLRALATAQHVEVVYAPDGTLRGYALDIVPALWHRDPRPTSQLVDAGAGVRGQHAPEPAPLPPVALAFTRRPPRPSVPPTQLLARAHKRARRRLAAIAAAYRALGRAARFAAAEYVLASRPRRQFRTPLVGTLIRNAPPAAA